MAEALVQVLRGPLVESIHRGDLAVVNSAGRLLASVGDPGGTMAFWRSAAKPCQALGLITTGAADRCRLTSQDLALASGSHNGEPVHTDQALALMTRIGCELTDLVCGAHAPLDTQTAAELNARNEAPTALHNNCSGKHLGMIAVAQQLGVGRVGYQSPDHPAAEYGSAAPGDHAATQCSRAYCPLRVEEPRFESVWPADYLRPARPPSPLDKENHCEEPVRTAFAVMALSDHVSAESDDRCGIGYVGRPLGVPTC